MPRGIRAGADPPFDGVLVVDKPSGPTSHDVVTAVRRVLRTQRVGHTGTLDPLATGVLPLVVGRATRLARFLAGATKAYRATIRLGTATDTHDALGRPVGDPVQPPSVAPDTIERALGRFRGRFLQVPPAFSAKRIEGTRAYSRARAEQPVTLVPAAVQVLRLDLESVHDDTLVVLVECSAGFYVRALARDLGEALGCGAHLAALRRTRSGEFSEADAAPLAAAPTADELRSRMVPTERLLPTLPTAHVGPDAAVRIAHGNPIAGASVERWDPPGSTCGDAGDAMAASRGDEAHLVRVAGPDGRLLAIARHRPEASEGAVALHPFVVLV
jgi:tRNA pseudouridine55 synthase